MKRLQLEEREKGLEAVARFLKYWSKMSALKGNGRVQRFDCTVELRFDWFSEEFVKECHTDAILYPVSGKLFVSDSEWFTDPWVHQEYSPTYQTYRWRKKRKVLRIYGRGTKKGYSDYRLSIFALPVSTSLKT